MFPPEAWHADQDITALPCLAVPLPAPPCVQVLALFLLGNLLTSCAILPLIFGLMPGRFCKYVDCFSIAQLRCTALLYCTAALHCCTALLYCTAVLHGCAGRLQDCTAMYDSGTVAQRSCTALGSMFAAVLHATTHNFIEWIRFKLTE